MQPTVSFGVPVYNGHRHLRDTLDSLLAQTYSDFELIISDNASTDATPDICQEYASRDSRVQYHRQPENIGAPKNWNFVARKARGRYFKWSSASDSCRPDFLTTCVPILEDDPSIVVSFGETCYVDDEGQSVALPDRDVEVLDDSPNLRFRNICDRLSINNEQYGLIRRDALMRTGLVRPYPHGDLVLMAELALLGKFKRVPSHVLVRRLDERDWTGMMSREAFDSLFWPDSKPQVRFDLTRRHLDYFRICFCHDLSLAERFKVTQYALRMAYWGRRKITAELASWVGRTRDAHSSGAH
jgi:glycosyltransferase involved in cell wall biosynthesis